MTEDTTSQDFFEAKYQHDSDPWRFASSTYELERYAAVLGVLGNNRFRRAFEPGCSIGVLTHNLAGFCASVEAIDISPSAVSQARERCKSNHNVTISVGALPDSLPEGLFDLILLVEIGYYFTPPVLKKIVQSFKSRLERGGVLLAEHWLGNSKDHRLSGDQVHEAIRGTAGLVHEVSQRHDLFRIDKWSRG